MKVIVTGSLGNISKPLTQELVQQGHAVTVVSSKPEKQKDIEALGATAAIGSLEDVDFLAATFTGILFLASQRVLMLPPEPGMKPQQPVRIHLSKQIWAFKALRK